MKFHELTELFPIMEGEAFNALAADIKSNGLIHPIVTYQDAILDGRNRFRSCNIANVKPRFDRYTGSDPLGYVISVNIAKRHLNESQRAIIAAKIATCRVGGQVADSRSVTQERASTLFNVSVRTIQRARIVIDKASDFVDLIMKGRMSVADATKLAKNSAENQKQIRSKIESGEAKNAKAAKKVIKKEEQAAIPDNLPSFTDRYDLIVSDLANAAIPKHSIDVIVTDPPYPEEFLDVYPKLGALAARVLKPGGSCIVMIGQSYLPEILTSMCKHLKYRWELAYHTPGGQSAQLWDRTVNTFWKPLLWFVSAGQYDGPWIGDFIKSDINDNDKRFHHWGQNERGMARIVETFSKPGDHILDPFCGGGTTGAVSLQLNRYFTGVDIDKQAIRTTAQRLHQIDITSTQTA